MNSTVYLVHYTSSPGGLEVLMPVIINEIKDRKVKVFVIRPPVNINADVYKGVPVDVTYGSKSTLIALVKFFFYVFKNRKGLFHLFNTGPYFLMVLNIIGVRQVIYSIHGTVYWKTSFQKLIRRIGWYLAISKRMIFTANSEYSAGIFKKLINKKAACTILYNPIDTARFNLKDKAQSKELYKIIYAGRLVAGKNLTKWINAANYILKSGINAVFEIYGTGPAGPSLHKEIKRLGLGDKIILKGYNNEIEKVYKNADLLLFLSEKESFGNVVVESILCGTPVLVFDIPAMKEIFCEFPQFLIQNGTGYCNDILIKLNNIEELKNTALKASENFNKRFNEKTFSFKLAKIYEELN